jgi:hypothetical protein
MHPKLERALPLLEHLASGGKVKVNNGTGLYSASCMNLARVLDNVDAITIHREPREIYVNHYSSGAILHLTPEDAALACQKDGRTMRYVEDLNWKPS